MIKEYNEEILYSFPPNGVSFGPPVTKTQNSEMINAVAKIMSDTNEKAGIKESALIKLIGCIGFFCFLSQLVFVVIETPGGVTMYLIIFVPILIGIAGLFLYTANSRGSSCFENKRKDKLNKYLEANRASIEKEIQAQGWKFNYSFNVGSDTSEVREHTKHGYTTENRTVYLLQGHIRFFNERSGFSFAPSPALQPNSMPNQPSQFQRVPPIQFGSYEQEPLSIDEVSKNLEENKNSINAIPASRPQLRAPDVILERADQMPPIQQI